MHDAELDWQSQDTINGQSLIDLTWTYAGALMLKAVSASELF